MAEYRGFLVRQVSSLKVDRPTARVAEIEVLYRRSVTRTSQDTGQAGQEEDAGRVGAASSPRPTGRTTKACLEQLGRIVAGGVTVWIPRSDGWPSGERRAGSFCLLGTEQ